MNKKIDYVINLLKEEVSINKNILSPDENGDVIVNNKGLTSLEFSTRS